MKGNLKRSGVSETFNSETLTLYIHGGFNEQQPHRDLFKVDFKPFKTQTD